MIVKITSQQCDLLYITSQHVCIWMDGEMAKINNITSHHSDVIMGTMASQIASLMIVYSTVYTGADQRKHQRSASLAFVRGIRRWPVNSPHKWPVTQKMFPFDDVIMNHIARETRFAFYIFANAYYSMDDCN